MNTEAPFYQRKIEEELARRTESNPRYSMRAFSKALGLVPSALSEVLNGKRIPTVKMAQKIFKRLDFSPGEQQSFLSSIAEQYQRRGAKRLSPLLSAVSGQVKPARELSVDMFRVMADWYHAAILELTLVKGFKADPRWIASQLGISISEARLAVTRLKELGLLEEREGQIKKTDEQLTTADKNITTAAHKKSQRQSLEKAIFSLENDDISRRSFTTLTMAIDPKKINEAKDLIKKFNRSMCKLLEDGDRTSVYNLTVSLYPVSRN